MKMNLPMGILGAVIGAGIGAAVWAAIGYFASVEIGLIAVGVGALAGVGATAATGGQKAPILGCIAIAAALLGIAVGKYAAVSFLMRDAFDESGFDAAMTEGSGLENDEEYLISFYADDVVEEWEERGKALNWPAGVDPEEGGTDQGDYPRDVWAEAQARWDDLTDAQREERWEEHRENMPMMREMMEGMTGSLRRDLTWAAFKADLNFFDALWVLFACGAAWGIAGREE